MKTRALKKAQQSLLQRVNAQKLACENKKSQAFALPDIQQAYNQYVQAFFASMSNSALCDKAQSALQEYHQTLAKHGYSEDDFKYTPACNICADTGVVDGKPCECVRQDYLHFLSLECGVDNVARFRFEDCDFAALADAPQLKDLQKLYKMMATIPDKFPNQNVKILTLSGGVGTGKSCLASAIVRKALDKGLSAKALSAHDFNALMLKAHTSEIQMREDLMSDILDCDFLMIDDLGIEPMYRNVTVEYLLLVLQQRLACNLFTIITTNHSADQLLAKYGERIYSRLSDKHNSLFLTINGKDLRRLK